MIEKINPTIPIPITSSPIPDEQREIIMAKSSIAIPNPIFFIVNPPIIIFVFLLLTRFFSHFHFFIEIASKSMSFPLAMNHGYTDV